MSKETKFVLGICIPIIALIVIAGYFIWKSTGPNPKYWVERAEYDKAVEAFELEVKKAEAIIAEKDQAIIEADQIISDKNAVIESQSRRIVSQGRENRRLARETANLRDNPDAQAVIEANPVIRDLINNYELRCQAYEEQIFTLSAQVADLGVPKQIGVDAITSEPIWEYPEGSVTYLLNQKYLRAEEKYSVEHQLRLDEHKLRLDGDDLRFSLEKRYKTAKFWAFIGKWAPPITFALGLIFGK